MAHTLAPGPAQAHDPRTELPTVQETDAPRWRLFFLLARDSVACVRITMMITWVVILLVFVMIAAAASAAYVLVRLVPTLHQLPTAPGAVVTGSLISVLTATVLGQTTKLWRAHRQPSNGASPTEQLTPAPPLHRAVDGAGPASPEEPRDRTSTDDGIGAVRRFDPTDDGQPADQ